MSRKLYQLSYRPLIHILSFHFQAYVLSREISCRAARKKDRGVTLLNKHHSG